MKKYCTLFFLLLFAASLASCASARRDREGNVILTKTEVAALQYNHNKSVGYLNEARAYRAQGRYELARQSYTQALSICSDGPTLKVIQRELEGINLLLRTMR